MSGPNEPDAARQTFGKDSIHRCAGDSEDTLDAATPQGLSHKRVPGRQARNRPLLQAGEFLLREGLQSFGKLAGGVHGIHVVALEITSRRGFDTSKCFSDVIIAWACRKLHFTDR